MRVEWDRYLKSLRSEDEDASEENLTFEEQVNADKDDAAREVHNAPSSDIQNVHTEDNDVVREVDDTAAEDEVHANAEDEVHANAEDEVHANTEDDNFEDDVYVPVRARIDKYGVGKYLRRRGSTKFECESTKCATNESDVESEYLPSDELHSLSSSSDNGSFSDDFAEFDRDKHMKVPELKLWMRYADPREFREALKTHAAQKGYCYKFVKNEWHRVRVECEKKTEEGCKWVCHASWDRDGEYFQIKTWGGKHTCGKPVKNKKVTSTWLAMHYLENFRDDPSMSADAFITTMLRDLGLSIPPHVSWRARKIALELIDGKHKEQYAKTADYANMILITNPGSRAILECSPQLQGPGVSHLPLFERMFVAFAACIKGFKEGCRHFIGLDGCHLKTSAGGILLCAVARDGNNQMFPLAIAQVAVECKDSWQWFLENLLEALRPMLQENLTFISDRQKVHILTLAL